MNENFDELHLASAAQALVRWVKPLILVAGFALLLQIGTAIGLVTQASQTATRLASLRDENASLRMENAKLRNELNRE